MNKRTRTPSANGFWYPGYAYYRVPCSRLLPGEDRH